MLYVTPLPGPARDVLFEAAAALDAAQARGEPTALSLALSRLARAYRGLGAHDLAEDLLEQALRWSRATDALDQSVDLLCTLCECAADLADAHDAAQPGSERGHAARERARFHAFEAGTLSARVSDPRWEIQVLLRVSDVFDRCGDRDDALALQARALRLMAGDRGPLQPDLTADAANAVLN